MTKLPGKKLGTLDVTLDRKKDNFTWAKISVELRFDLDRGVFHALYDGT